MGNAPIPPTILTLLVCEKFIMDRITNQASIIGILQVINVPSFPVMTPPMGVFVEITGCHGPVEVVVRIVDANEARPAICEAKMSAIQPDPLAMAGLAIGLPPLRIEQEGEYRIQAISGGNILLEKRLLVRKIATSKQPKAD